MTLLKKKKIYAARGNETFSGLLLIFGVSGTLKINREYYIVFIQPWHLGRITFYTLRTSERKASILPSCAYGMYGEASVENSKMSVDGDIIILR